MGLRVVAYQSLQALFIETDEQLEELRKEMFTAAGTTNLVVLSKHPMYPDRADYLPSGFFRYNGDVLATELGSTLDYANFREALAQKLTGRPAAAVDLEPLPGPFLELIHFSPIGQHYVIGPKTADKLAQDFKDHIHVAEKIGGSFWVIYERLMKCFSYAAKSGAIRFSS